MSQIFDVIIMIPSYIQYTVMCGVEEVYTRRILSPSAVKDLQVPAIEFSYHAVGKRILDVGWDGV
jgi:hypothetical protein